MKLSRSHAIPLLWSLLFPAVGVGVYFLIYWNWSSLPEPVLITEEVSDQPVFVAERAHSLLRQLTSKGPRVVGSSTNEVLTVNFLLDTINQIARDADPSNLVSVEVQDASGSMLYYSETYPMTSFYRDVQNVVATVRKRSDSQFSGRYLLLNSHFDTVITSSGAGDDGTMVVVMLEVLKQISRLNLDLKHGLIFLFNGCEENTLQGSHGFVTGHSLANNVSAFLNLDIASNTGREIMFQSGPNYPFLMQYYQKFAKRPYANSVGEEVFQLGLVPSGTDYEVFTQFGNWPGMDFALSSYGYLYHTKYDALSSISPGTLQHIGDNLLPIAIALAKANELNNISEHELSAATFFDYLHLFEISYDRTLTYVINCLVAVVGLILIIVTIVMMVKMEGAKLPKILLECGITLIVQTVAILLGAGVTIAIASILDAANRSMSWYTSNWLIFGLYFVPFILCLTIVPWLYIRYRKVSYLNNQGRVLLFLHSQCLIFIALLLTLTVAEIRSGYLLLFPVIFHSLSTIVNIFLKFKLNHWIYVQVIGQIIPMVYFCALSITVFTVFIPLTGRGDPGANPDFMMALFSILMSLLLFGLLIPLVVLLPKIRYFNTLLALFFLCNVIVAFTPVGFPFREATTPQRYYIFHQARRIFNADGSARLSTNNFFVYSMDRHTRRLLAQEVPIWEQSQPISDFCEQDLYCGFPFYNNRYHRYREHSFWLPAKSEPTFPEPVRLQLLEKQDISPNHRRYSFSLEGPTLMGLYVSPHQGNNLTRWSFSNSILPGGTPWRGQPVYYVNLIQAKTPSPLLFTLQIRTSSTLQPDVTTLRLNIVGNYMHHEEAHTSEFRQLIELMPPYMHTVAYPSYLESREF
ncbi:endoplasmic reticulum metallopeptidase 1-like [Uranotaenia lowii]|uniref:endoplasmic reticulum metallopeptidase 1-like n=1 Tax=Uranotaenia lowii TaxID=190385 RepID=UPI00247A830C|nr:endoplasmic reticulum metallopeptidase 1-like [Uranotaenia lowii]